VQLKKVEWMRQQRCSIALRYKEIFRGTDVKVLTIPDDCETSWHLFVVKIPKRDQAIIILKELGIGSSVHFIPIHRHSYYVNTYELSESDYSVADKVFDQSLSLPIYPGLTMDQVENIAYHVKSLC